MVVEVEVNSRGRPLYGGNGDKCPLECRYGNGRAAVPNWWHGEEAVGPHLRRHHGGRLASVSLPRPPALLLYTVTPIALASGGDGVVFVPFSHLGALV